MTYRYASLLPPTSFNYVDAQDSFQLSIIDTKISLNTDISNKKCVFLIYNIKFNIVFTHQQVKSYLKEPLNMYLPNDLLLLIEEIINR